MNPEAKAHYDRGLELYAGRDFAAAARELEQGFVVEPRREFLFAAAQALRLAGACQRAIPLYRRFLESDPAPVQIEAARLGLDRCAPERSTPRSNPASNPAPNPASLTPPPPVPTVPEPRATPRSVWWHDAWAASSCGAGIVALGVGVGFTVGSNRAVDEANSDRTMNLPDFERLWKSAQQRRTIGVTSLVGGAVLLMAAGGRLIVVHGRERAAEQPGAILSFTSLPGGGAFTWRAPF
jgi:hypothetical protein